MQIEQFVLDGFICIENAFSQETAAAALDILWKDIPFDRYDSSTWTEPVVRLGMYTQKPFVESLNNLRMHSIFDQLIGENRWIPCRSVGTFPVRFPSTQQPNDTGKHVDVSFTGNDPNNYFEWRANIKSKGRALLMLVLYSDVSETDAPTVIYQGSHIDVAKLLATEGDFGLSFMELAHKASELPQRKVVHATGAAAVSYHSPDPRIKLRERTELSEEEFMDLKNKLKKLDHRSSQGAWTEKVLLTIKGNPNLHAVGIANLTGFEKEWLKLNIRKLKNMGLTISHTVGYEISPLGNQYLSGLTER